MTYQSQLPPGRDGFGQLVLAEWTKLRSVPRWMLTMLAAVLLIVLVALLTATASAAGNVGTGGGEPVQADSNTEYQDRGLFVHRPLTGDGSVVARVASQDHSHEWAKAGVMVKERAWPGAPYAAVMVTPDHGVRLQSNFSEDVGGAGRTAPRWLKLTRSGSTVTGYESADGAWWLEVGAFELDGLPRTVEVGLFVASPTRLEITRQFGGESIDEIGTEGRAVFDNVSVSPEQPQELAPWQDYDQSLLDEGSSTERAGTFTLTASGDIGLNHFRDDVPEMILTSIVVGLIAVVALAVLFITAEYKRGTIRTTFAASPRRGRVLAAKAVVIGAATFVATLPASFAAFLLAAPILRSNGLSAPPLSDGPVLRAVVGTAALLGVIAVLSLAVATMLRHSAAAISSCLLLLLVPQIVATGLPLTAAMWVERLTPAAGFAIQQTVDRYDTAISPLAGFAVLCGYTAAVLALAFWRVRRSDA